MSRVIPSIVKGYKIICGPFDKDITENKTYIENSDQIRTSGSYHNSEETKIWFVKEYKDHCKNAVVYENRALHEHKSMYYILSGYADIRLYEDYNVTIVFRGQSISVISNVNKGASSKGEGRYYFANSLKSYSIYKPGVNFLYIARNRRVSCNLGTEGQKNIAVIQGYFSDSEGIHSIIGSNGIDIIDVYRAGYVDGKGGNDRVTAHNSATIKSYFGDFIYGKGLSLLPISFSDIDKVKYHNNIVEIYNKSGNYINIYERMLIKTVDSLFITPTKADNETSIVTNVQMTRVVGSNVILDNELNNLRKTSNANFNVTKQLLSSNYHITVGDSGSYVFYPDKERHDFYWEAPSNLSHLYLFDKRNANITIAKANGILDFSQLNSTLNNTPFIKNNKGEIKISKEGLNVTLLPDYKNVTVTFDGKEYYKLQNITLERDYCSHGLKIDGRFNVNGTDLLNHHNCFTFNSDKVLFLKLNNDLLLLSGKQTLSISDYYSSVHRNWDLSIVLNNKIIEPEEFRKRASNPNAFRYYQLDKQKLQIYHNQPINKNDIGLVDLEGKSILNCDMKVTNGSLVLSYESNTVIEIENWVTCHLIPILINN